MTSFVSIFRYNISLKYNKKIPLNTVDSCPQISMLLSGRPSYADIQAHNNTQRIFAIWLRSAVL